MEQAILDVSKDILEQINVMFSNIGTGQLYLGSCAMYIFVLCTAHAWYRYVLLQRSRAFMVIVLFGDFKNPEPFYV